MTETIVRDSGNRKIRDFDRYSGGGILENLGTGYDIGKENGIRNGDDRRSECGIIVKKK